MADWSTLPRDVLEKIGKLIAFPIDHERIRAVCMHWRTSLPRKPCFASLIFHPDHYTKKQQRCHRSRCLSLFGIGAGKDYGGCGSRFRSLFGIGVGRELNPPPLKLKLPEGEVPDNEDVAKDNLVFKGYSHGCIIAVGKNPEIYLINLSMPFKDRLLQLPPITTFPQVPQYQPDRVGKEYKCHGGRFKSSESMRATFIKKVVLSSSSPSAPDTIAVAIAACHESIAVRHEPMKLAFCRLGDPQWIYLNDHYELLATDIVFSNNHFFWVFHQGHVGDVRFVSLPDLLTIYSSPSTCIPDLIKNIVVLPKDKFPDKAFANVYFVTCPGGDLLYVTRYHIGKTTHFRVFNFSCLKYSSISSSNQQSNEEIEEMESLGDYVLFLGYNNDSWYIPSCNFPADFPGPKMNCIYFTDDHSLGCSDMSIFDYENKTISPFYKHRPDLPSPIWFMPYPSNAND